MSRTSVFTTITPLPAGITRQSVIDMYHSHTEMIELNPLVIDRYRCKAPSYAPAEEFYSTWYTIKDKVSYLPGGRASSSVSYHACFHDLPSGLQTHVYAPLGLDIRAKWSVGGSLPGEPPAPVELGIGAPRSGLYIREDVHMKCNIMMMSFVKKTFKESHAKMVDRLVEKAHVLESKQANDRLNQLKNVAPGERMGHGSITIAPPPGYEEKPLPRHPRESVLSDGSGHSSLSSQASTLTSPSEFLQELLQQQQQQQQYGHQRSHSHSQTDSPSPHTTSDANPHPPLQQYHSHHTYSRSQGSFRLPTVDQSSADQPRNRQPSQAHPQSQTLSYLPATTYNPYQPQQQHATPEPNHDASQWDDLQPPPPVELPAHMQDSPTLPRDAREDRGRRYIAELPA